jgi:phospholipid transport system transporter-binding protein
MKGETSHNARVAVTEPSSGRIVVTGELTFATARDARQLGVAVFESTRAPRIVVDCAAVTRADSAGLAVLLDWLSWGRRHSRPVSLENLPASLLAIARISEVDGLLTATG